MKEEIHKHIHEVLGRHHHGPWWGGGHHKHHRRGRRGGPGRDRGWQEFFGHGGFPFGGFGGHGFGGGRERLERGLLRHVILSVLKDGPAHGYEIIKHLEDRTHGRYSPSPGTLYPTLQYLEDLGLIRSEQQADKRVYQLTDAGREELDKQSSHVEGFWSRFRDHTPGGANMHELRFAADALKDLLRTLSGGFEKGAFSHDVETVRKVRAAIEKCQNEVRQIIAEGAGNRPTSESRKEGNPDVQPLGDERYV